MNPIRIAAGSVLALLVSGPALGADGPAPIRSIAPDTSYVVVSADDFAKTVESGGVHKHDTVHKLDTVFIADIEDFLEVARV